MPRAWIDLNRAPDEIDPGLETRGHREVVHRRPDDHVIGRQQFLDDPGIRIPAVVWELSSRRVLCLDYLPGIKITEREALLVLLRRACSVAHSRSCRFFGCTSRICPVSIPRAFSRGA